MAAAAWEENRNFKGFCIWIAFTIYGIKFQKYLPTIKPFFRSTPLKNLIIFKPYNGPVYRAAGGRQNNSELIFQKYWLDLGYCIIREISLFCVKDKNKGSCGTFTKVLRKVHGKVVFSHHKKVAMKVRSSSICHFW